MFSRLILTLLCAVLLPGCALCPWYKKDGGDAPSQFGVISVQLNKRPPKSKATPTYAVASVKKRKGDDVRALRPVDADGRASFVLSSSDVYDIRIFTDLNGNQTHDTGEPMGRIDSLAPAPATTADAAPVGMAFGVYGSVAAPVQKAADPQPAPETTDPRIPPEAEGYLHLVPGWVRERAGL